jgi:hypothetical protein
MSHYALVPVAEEESEEMGLTRQSIGTPVLIDELGGQPVLSFDEDGPAECEQYSVQEVESDIVAVTTNRATYLLPATMPVAVSGVVKVPDPDPRIVGTGLDLKGAGHAAGWVPAGQLRWNDGLFWAPEFGSGEVSGRVDEDENSAPPKPRLRWIELVMKVAPYVPKKTDSRLQVLTAPSYFVASGDHDSHGILVSGVVTVSPLQAPDGPDGQTQTSTAKRRTTTKKTV